MVNSLSDRRGMNEVQDWFRYCHSSKAIPTSTMLRFRSFHEGMQQGVPRIPSQRLSPQCYAGSPMKRTLALHRKSPALLIVNHLQWRIVGVSTWSMPSLVLEQVRQISVAEGDAILKTSRLTRESASKPDFLSAQHQVSQWVVMCFTSCSSTAQGSKALRNN
nr:hypothetical protein CFP56_09483 [Quercus suber]